MQEISHTAFITEALGPHARQLCLALAARGYAIGFTYNCDEEDAVRFRRELEAAGALVECFHVGQYSAEELSNAVINTAEAFGGMELLAFFGEAPENCRTDAKLLLDLDETDWDQSMGRGAKGFFLCCKYALPYLISRTGARVVVFAADDPGCEDCSLTDYVANRALQAAAAHIETELSHYGVSVAYRSAGVKDWLEDLLDGLPQCSATETE